ncbi:MAG: hypothetical protein H6810_02520 [Phycisphaeraceae bacterium]|nr:MAG: hypothetical protein H6810_02520 [Phycisphaeraceae bacterium]
MGVEANLAGYARRVAGEVLDYHSPDPDVTHGLLVRSLDAARSISWETAPAPDRIDGEFVEFVWMFALDVNPERRRFELRVNDEAWFEFFSPQSDDVRDWTVGGPDGSTLRFRATMLDRFDDLMGYAILRVPKSQLTPGEPLRLSVVGESAGSRTWYITFMSPVAEGASVTTPPALLRGAHGNKHPIVLKVTHLGPPVEAVVSTSFGPELKTTLQLGGNRVQLLHPEVSGPTGFSVEVRVGQDVRQRLTGTLEPVRKWTIDLVQHTHTDVGYTRPQTEILPEHLRYIDTALDYCDQTDDYPDDARFRWTCEASWAVREYLKSRTPDQIERLRRRVLEGRIEVTGLFLNVCEVMDEAGYAAFLAPVRLFHEQGLPVTTGMQNDINGAAWCLADAFSDIGIEYLTMGQHGHRALVPFDKPTCFWWESPSGSRVLAFRADHYMTGNFWGVHTGKVEVCEEGLLHYLEGLERAGYPFDRVAVQHSGYATDNSPPSTASSEFVREWNEKYAWPHVRTAIDRDFVKWVKQNHADELQVCRAAWPDWWTDGFGSAARESAEARITQSQLVAVDGLLAMERLLGIEPPAPLLRQADEIRDDLLFYGEHTFGAAESIREPLCENSVVQWNEKAAYAWDAVKRVSLLTEGAIARFPSAGSPADTPRLVVVNTLNFPRSGLLELYVDHELLPVDRPFRLLDQKGEELPVQLVRSRTEGSYWAIWATDVPAFGSRSYRVEVDTGRRIERGTLIAPASGIENTYYRIVVDPESATVTALIDKRTGRDLLDIDSRWKMGQVVYETLGNREQLEAFMLEDYARQAWTDPVVEGVEKGPVSDSLHLRGELPFCEGPGGVRCEIRLFHAEPRIEWHYTIQKRRNFDPEAIYVAFPFAPKEGEIVYETLGGIASPATDILPGASSDWQTMQSFAAARFAGGQIVLSSDEIPLVQFGDINTGRFRREAVVEQPHVFSWVMNNYWTTNYKASQEGEFRWSYAMTASPDASDGFATRFGWGHRIPLLGRVLPGSGEARPLENESLLELGAENLILVAARTAAYGPGVVLQLREVEGRPVRLGANDWGGSMGALRVREVNVLEEVFGAAEATIKFGPFETKFLLVEGKVAGQ